MLFTKLMNITSQMAMIDLYSRIYYTHGAREEHSATSTITLLPLANMRIIITG